MLLSELLPVSGPQHASTVRSRTLRAGAEIVRAHAAETANQTAAQAARGPVVVGSVSSRATRSWIAGRGSRE
jgi:hypothetical protein